MANPYSDPRYELARSLRQQRSGGGRTYQPSTEPMPSTGSVKLGRAASAAMVNNPTLKQQIENIAAGKKQESGGALGAILNNPIAKVALAPLEVLAVPGRAVVSGVREIADIVDNNPNTSASFGDFVNQVKDRSFGFGKAFKINTGNKWLDRAIGFVGDVALDPLTYATFGAGKFTGYGGRLQLSKKVLDKTGDAALAQRVANFGRSAIKSPELMDAVGANRYGIYFLGKRIKVGKLDQGLRLPGSGAIGQFGDQALARLRIAASNTKVGQVLTKMTTRGDYLDARMALRRGDLPSETAGVIINALTLEPTRRAAAGKALLAETNNLKAFLSKEELNGLEGYRKVIYEYLENPTAVPSAEVQRAVDEWTNFFDRFENEVGRQMNEIDPSVDFQGVKNYFPYVRTEEAVNYVRTNNQYSDALEKIFSRDPFETPGRFRTRGLAPGDDWFGYTLKPEDMNIKRLNEIARTEGKLNFDFFETDIVAVAERYIQDYATEVGILAGHKSLLDGGFWKMQQDVLRDTEIIDKEAIGFAKQAVTKIDSEVQNVLGETLSALNDFTDALGGRTKALADEVEGLSAKGSQLGELESVAKIANDIDTVIDGGQVISADVLRNVADRLGEVRTKLAEMFGATVTRSGKLKQIPDVVGKMIDDGEDIPLIAEGLTDYLTRIQSRLLGLAEDVQRGYDELAGIEDLRLRSVEQDELLEKMKREVEDAQVAVRVAMEFGNYIEFTVEKIVDGVDPTDALKMVDDMLVQKYPNGIMVEKTVRGKKTEVNIFNDVLFELRTAGGKAVKIIRPDAGAPSDVIENIKKVLGASGKFTEYVGLSSQTQRWKAWNTHKPIPYSRVARYSAKDFYDNLSKLKSGELSLTEIREMALYVLLRDEHMYGGRVPSSVAGLRKRLMEVLEGSDLVDANHTRRMANFGKKQGTTPQDIFDSVWKPEMVRAQRAQEELASMDEFIDLFEPKILAQTEDTTVTVQSLLDNLSADYPMLETIFGSSDNYVAGRIDMVEEMMGARPVSTTPGYGQEEITLRQLLDAVKAERQKVNDFLNGEPTIVIGQGATAKNFNGSQVLSEGTKRAAADGVTVQRLPGVGKEDWTRVNQNVRRGQRPEPGTTIPIPGRAGLEVSIEKARNDLADSLLEYTMVSEVNMRFESVATVLGGFNLIPTESMFNNITTAVANKFLPQIDSQISDIIETQAMLKELEAVVERRIREAQGTGVTAGQIFREEVSKLMNSPRGEKLQSTISSVGGWMDDAYELRRGLKNAGAGKVGTEKTVARKAFFESRVKPWFKSRFPNEPYSQKAALARLRMESPSAAKGQRSSMLSPFAETASPSVVANWFKRLLGETTVPYYGRSGQVVSGGSELQRRLSELRRVRRRFKTLELPDLEMARFFQNPTQPQRTPSWYADSLRFHAEKLELLSQQLTERQLALGATETNRLSLVDETAENLRAAGSMRAGRKLPGDTREYNDLKQARKDIKEYEGLVASVNYAAAERNERTFNVLESLAHLDLSKVQDGFVLSYSRETGAPVFALMPDGSRLVFSEAEWNSLFNPRYTEQNAAVVRSELGRLTNSISSQRRKVEQMEIAVNSAPQPLRDVQPGLSVRRGQEYKAREQVIRARQRAIAQVESEKQLLNELIEEQRRLRFELEMNSPEVRAAARQKMDVLVHGTRTQEPYFNNNKVQVLSQFNSDVSEMLPETRKGLNLATNFTEEQISSGTVQGYDALKVTGLQMRQDADFVRFRLTNTISSQQATQRAQYVRAAWNASEDSKVISKAEELRKSVHVVAYNDLLNSPQKLQARIDDIAKQQERVLAEIGYTQSEINDLLASSRRNFDAGVAEAERRRGNVVDAPPGGPISLAGPMGMQPPVDPAVAARNLRFEAELLQDAATPTGPMTEGLVGPIVPTRTTEADVVFQGQRAFEAGQDYGYGLNVIKPKIDETSAQLKRTADAYDDAVQVETALRQARADVVDEMAVVAGSPEAFWNLLYNRRAEFQNAAVRYQTMKEFVDSLPSVSSTKEVKKLFKKSGKVDDVQARHTLGLVREWIDQNKDVLDNLARDPDDPVNVAMAAVMSSEAKLLELEFRRQDALEVLALRGQPQFHREVVQAFSDGWEDAAKKAGLFQGQTSLAGFGLPGLYGNEEAVKLLQNISRIRKPGVAQDMARFMTGYTRFFKAYATMSPGFHVRNSISNIFSIFSAGADLPNMREGLRLYRLFSDHVSKGGDLDSWLKTLPADKVEGARTAAEVMLGLGGGRTDEALSDFVRRGGVIRDNPLLRWSHRTGHGVEGSARFILAYDSAAKGMDMSSSFERTHRYLIDYQNRSLLDESMRDIIPFWMWMSRNLPLQLINRWTNPKAYLVYEKFANNFGLPIGEEEGIPNYIQQQGGIRLGGETFLTPDLPFSRIDQQLNEIANPSRLLGYVNPGIRVPLEVLGGTKFGSGIPFSDKKQKLTGTFRAFEPLLRAMGQIEYNSKGEPVVSEKAMYAILGMIPPIGTAERLFPSTEQYKERNTQSVLSFMGIPLRTVDQKAKDNEMLRRMYEMQRLTQAKKRVEEAQ